MTWCDLVYFLTTMNVTECLLCSRRPKVKLCTMIIMCNSDYDKIFSRFQEVIASVFFFFFLITTIFSTSQPSENPFPVSWPCANWNQSSKIDEAGGGWFHRSISCCCRDLHATRTRGKLFRRERLLRKLSVEKPEVLDKCL